MYIGIHKYIFMIQSINTGVVRHTWVYKKSLGILNLQLVKTELSYDVDFLHMSRHP